ncbi:hypothetical protein [Nocardioides sp. AX2bis]|uniref:hypothetical protein n=1 Tax=Nocardioides sp. AX2bis TaxID=2653157 RepID=UPI0012F3EDE6|nr:hypothetical protein [Nocardioides sp. AX2bis]VXC36769.1 conserved exported hypothetical protein [Nocardioides sp. AX2bis]
MTRSLVRVSPGVSLPTPAEALAGTVPTFVVHRSYNNAGLLPDLVVRAQRVCTTDAAVGVATRLPVQTPTAARKFLNSVSTATLRFADPEIHTLPGPNIAPHSRHLRFATRYNYASAAMPATPNSTWVREVLDAQHDAGANVLLSASGWVGSAQSAQQLATAISFVTATRAELGSDDPMFVNLTLDTAWLTDATLRARLLQEIVESPEPLWWLRVMWPPIRPNPYSQLTATTLLNAYRELAQVASDEGKVLFLPNSGLTGWYATALGASGFSTGMSSTERAYLNQPPPSGGGGNPPRERVFERNVLHTILRTDQPPLTRQAGYQACGCAYCQQLANGPWQQKVEQLHYLLNGAELTATLGRTGRRAAGHARVQQADTFNRALSGAATLTGESEPKHLTEWEALLR